MTLISGFCPKCGTFSENGELCGNCRVKDTVCVTVPPRVECICCPSCGSIKTAGIWSDCPVKRNELAHNLANSVISIHNDAQNIQKDIHIIDVGVNRSVATFFVSGTLYDVPFDVSKKVKIVWTREQCDRCCRVSGGYYEGVIQVRAIGRKPTSFELNRAAEIAYQVENRLQTAGDRLSFVSDIDEQKDGIDIVFSSQTIGGAISHDICGALGGSFTTHPKLVGEKAGIKLYRVTYSIRLPRFSCGDIIRHGHGYFHVLRQNKDMLFVRDLATDRSHNFREKDEDVFISNIYSAKPTMVVYRDAGVLGILDPVTQEVREIPDYAWLKADTGDTILVVCDRDSLIITGKIDENSKNIDKSATEVQI
jgi:nonsense-mediated mRNA decay protein 3